MKASATPKRLKFVKMQEDDLSEATDRPILVYTTFPTFEDAKRVGDALVKARLAACVNIFPHMLAIFEWEGQGEHASEVAMIVKTRGQLEDAVLAETKRLHPYAVPALLVLPTTGGSADYCKWILDQTKEPSDATA